MNVLLYVIQNLLTHLKWVPSDVHLYSSEHKHKAQSVLVLTNADGYVLMRVCVFVFEYH